MTMTQQAGYTPGQITATVAQGRLREVLSLAEAEDWEEANKERAQLYLDVLFSIAYAPAIAQKGEMKRLALVALEAFEIPITGR